MFAQSDCEVKTNDPSCNTHIYPYLTLQLSLLQRIFGMEGLRATQHKADLAPTQPTRRDFLIGFPLDIAILD